jgi:hypothetical protein
MISEVLHFIDIDASTKERGPEIWRLLEPHVGAISSGFYRRVNTFNVTAPMSDATVQRLIGKQKQHWSALFGSRFDADYANSVRRVGIQHRDVSLSPMWYVLGYMTFKIAFTDILADTALPPIKKGRLIKALDKYIAFDMALALSTYSAALLD